jgi:hypothetical protein
LRSTLKERLSAITAVLEHDDSEQSQAFCKMAPFVFKSVVQIAKATHASEEDILGEVLCMFSAVRDLYQSSVYRYQDSHYVCCGEEGDFLLLETPKMNKHRRSLKVHKSEVSEVRRAAFFGFLYKKIQHQCAEILRVARTSKRSGSVEMVSWESLEADALSSQADFSSDPENLFSAAQMYHEIVPRISDPARQVLDLLMEEASLPDLSLSRLHLQMSMNSIVAAKQEILRAYHCMERSFVQDATLQPIYLKASDL